MKNLSIGTDLVDITRIEKIYKKYGDKFAKKILHDDELKNFKNSCKTPSQFLAKHFAVKEASAKVLGTGFQLGVSFKDIHLYRDNLGKPELKFSGNFAKLATQKNLVNWRVSLSDTDTLVLAFVIAY